MTSNEIFFIILSFTLPFLMTVLGSTLIFFFNKQSKAVNSITIGLASGIMLSASIWSLLVPSLEDAKSLWGDLAFIPAVIGLAIGCVFMIALDVISAYFLKKSRENTQNNAIFSSKSAFKLFTALTIHNIPEGLSVGFAVGTAVAIASPIFTPFMFALGIALQNFPEGLATVLPMYNSLGKKKKSFFLSCLSGIVEPIFAIAGFFLASNVTFLLPWLLSFSAGTMIYVIIQELLPEIKSENNSLCGVISFVIGFILMMLLDVCI